jgi:hypothetical protein
MGSFAVEKFSTGRLMEIGPSDIERRVRDFHRLVAFEAEVADSADARDAARAAAIGA